MADARAAVLVVDDEPAISSLIQKLLSRSGHTVHCCSTPAEALALQEPFGLAIVDYTLPAQDGLSLIGELRTRQPELAVILTSGAAMAPPETTPPIHYLQKPFRLAQLLKLTEALL
ncbi:MAG: response regulator [Bryobacterales bacterium]|nr:response regulator [Bryobacterales bacterium]